MLYSKIPKQHPAKAVRQSLHTARGMLPMLRAAHTQGETAAALPWAREEGSAERRVQRQVMARGGGRSNLISFLSLLRSAVAMHWSPRLPCDLAKEHTAGSGQWDHCAASHKLFWSPLCRCGWMSNSAAWSFINSPSRGNSTRRTLMQKAACKRQTPCQELSKDLPSSAQVSIPHWQERDKVNPSDWYATWAYYSTIGDWCHWCNQVT